MTHTLSDLLLQALSHLERYDSGTADAIRMDAKPLLKADPANAIAAAREALNYLVGYMDETEHATGVVMQCGIEHARAALALLEGVQP